MLNKNAFIAISAITLTFFSLNASALLIDFEDRGTSAIESGYQGLVWDDAYGDMSSLNGTTYGNSTSGYTTLANALSGDIVAYNGWANNPVDIKRYGGGTFDLTSAWFTSAWDSVLDMTFTGYNSGIEIYSMTFQALRDTAQQVTFNWTGIDTFRINDTGQHFAMDNLIINENTIPEPATLALIGLGLAGISFTRKKKQS